MKIFIKGIAVVLICAFATAGCASSKGCGCGSDLNKVYKSRRVP